MQIKNLYDYERFDGARRRAVVFLPPFMVIRHDGHTQTFYDLCEIPAHIKISRNRTWTHSYYVSETKRYHQVTYLNEYICRDDRGQVVFERDIIDARHKPFVNTRLADIRHASDLGLPIPYTGGNRWRGNYRRSVSYITNKREACANRVDDLTYKVKGKIRIVPFDPWDGLPRSSNYDRSWKTFRRTHYKIR